MGPFVSHEGAKPVLSDAAGDVEGGAKNHIVTPSETWVREASPGFIWMPLTWVVVRPAHDWAVRGTATHSISLA